MKMTILERIFSTSIAKRILFFLLADIVCITISLFLSFLFHFDFDMNVPYLVLMKPVLAYFVIIKILCFGIFRIYRMTWRYVGIFDLVNIVGALVVSLMVLIILTIPISFFASDLAITGFPKRIILEDSIISVFLISGLRISKRIFLEVIKKQGHTKKGKRTIIIGAGNTGEMILRDMVRNNFNEFYPIGFIDNHSNKIGTYIHGVKVLGDIEKLKEIILGNRVEAVIVAVPSLNHKTLKEIYNSSKLLKVNTIKIVPRIYSFDKPDINLKGLEDISIEDLVGRQSIKIDYKEIENFINNKRVLVTGAGGSIGSEIVMQVCAFHPQEVILFDIDETELHNLGLKLSRLFFHLSDHIHYVTGDVRDKMRLREVFESYKPEIVFHAAAYKHVPMMEYNPREAVKVNILGTYNLAGTAAECAVEKFIMISTDKAVRPTSIMGATKRVAEYICKGFNGNHSTHPSTHYISVRFGNVLGSRGSVLPLFLEQLKHGGPLTVTHKDMKRYFMTIPEAVSLVLQASTMGEGGEVFVLDMGEPVMITDVAEELIRIHGLEPYKDIDIKFTGLRPGEKLFEEILTAEEGTVASRHEKVFIARNSEKHAMEDVQVMLDDFRNLVADPSIENDGKVRDLLKKYVKHYEK